MMLKTSLPAMNDLEGSRVPLSFPEVVDAHVHVFPEHIFRAVWKWFDEYGWPVRYRISSEEIVRFLLERGVAHVVALQYSHKPGISVDLNQFMVELCRKFPGKITGMATVFPGEEGAEEILQKAFDDGLSGVKLHSHVQCFDMNSREMDIVYDSCSSSHKPLVMHVGREPKSPGYACDPYLICKAEKLETVVRNFPDLKVCVPHLGADEFFAYKCLIEKYNNLWLDTAMAITDYLPGQNPVSLHDMRADRILYGSDFPNIPYAWDREVKELGVFFQDSEKLKQILGAECQGAVFDMMESNITLIGMPGAGKSTIGIILAKYLTFGFIDTDVLIQINQQKSLQEIMDESDYLNLRRIEEHEILKINIEKHVISTGGSAVYSQKAMQHLKGNSKIIFLHVDFEEIRRRIHNFEQRGIAKRKDQTFRELFEERNILYERYSDLSIDCKNLDQEQIAEMITSKV